MIRTVKNLQDALNMVQALSFGLRLPEEYSKYSTFYYSKW